MSETINPNPNLSTEVKQFRRPPEVATDSEQAQLLLKAIYDAPPLTENSQIDQQLKGREALENKLYFNTEHFNQIPVELVIRAQDHKSPIQLPMDLVVGAEGFVSWIVGRSGKDSKTISTEGGYQTLPSIDVIKKYADMDPATRPTIPEFFMYIQPNGKVFFVNSNDGSHRLGAAVYNGETSIATESLRVRYLDEDIF